MNKKDIGRIVEIYERQAYPIVRDGRAVARLTGLLERTLSRYESLETRTQFQYENYDNPNHKIPDIDGLSFMQIKGLPYYVLETRVHPIVRRLDTPNGRILMYLLERIDEQVSVKDIKQVCDSKEQYIAKFVNNLILQLKSSLSLRLKKVSRRPVVYKLTRIN